MRSKQKNVNRSSLSKVIEKIKSVLRQMIPSVLTNKVQLVYIEYKQKNRNLLDFQRLCTVVKVKLEGMNYTLLHLF